MTLGPLTRDGVCRGLLDIWQPRNGYRFNLDSVLLAALAAPRVGPGLVVDAGAGAGVVGLYLARVTGAPVLLVERQPEVAALAARNARDNALGNARVIISDYRELPVADGSVGLLVSNPPYARPGTGRSSPNTHRRLSREAIHGGAAELLQEAVRVLRDDGHVALVGPRAVPAPAGLQLRAQLDLHRTEGGPLERVLALYARRCSAPCIEQRTLHTADGTFTPWVQDILEGRTRQLSLNRP